MNVWLVINRDCIPPWSNLIGHAGRPQRGVKRLMTSVPSKPYSGMEGFNCRANCWWMMSALKDLFRHGGLSSRANSWRMMSALQALFRHGVCPDWNFRSITTTNSKIMFYRSGWKIFTTKTLSMLPLTLEREDFLITTIINTLDSGVTIRLLRKYQINPEILGGNDRLGY